MLFIYNRWRGLLEGGIFWFVRDFVFSIIMTDGVQVDDDFEKPKKQQVKRKKKGEPIVPKQVSHSRETRQQPPILNIPREHFQCYSNGYLSIIIY